MLDPSRMYMTDAFVLEEEERADGEEEGGDLGEGNGSDGEASSGSDGSEEEGSGSNWDGEAVSRNHGDGEEGSDWEEIDGEREGGGVGGVDDRYAPVGPTFLWVPTLDDLGLEEQEQVVIQDLLYILVGNGCEFISAFRITEGNVGLHLDDAIHYKLTDLTTEIARVGTFFHRIVKFVESTAGLDFGVVNHALAAEMREVLQEYHLLICQLETMYQDGSLTIRKFYKEFYQTIDQMSSMCDIAIRIEQEKARGGRVLSIAHNVWVDCRPESVAMLTCQRLITKASAPYFRMIQKWAYKGLIEDPLKEFFISHGDTTGCYPEKGEEFKPREDYWTTRYICDLGSSPNFLRCVVRRIFRAGKYLNVLLQCEPDSQLLEEEELVFDFIPYNYIDPIAPPFRFAALTLLELMETKYDLMGKLTFVKSVFCLERGDFANDFLGSTQVDLSRPFWTMNQTRLQALLEYSLHTCHSTRENPYKDNFTIQLFDSPIREFYLTVLGGVGIWLQPESFKPEDLDNLPGIRMLTFNCKFDWPSSIVFNKETTALYQLISRHLIYCKYVEMRLLQISVQHKCKEHVDLEQATKINLRHKMLSCVQHLVHYATMEVIDQEWEIFLESAKAAMSLDTIMELHTRFLRTVLHDSMLNDWELLDRMTQLLTLCLEFCNRFSEDPPIPPEGDPVKKDIHELDREFNTTVLDFMSAAIRSLVGPDRSRKVINIVYRLNLTGYYARDLMGFLPHDWYERRWRVAVPNELPS